MTQHARKVDAVIRGIDWIIVVCGVIFLTAMILQLPKPGPKPKALKWGLLVSIWRP